MAKELLQEPNKINVPMGGHWSWRHFTLVTLAKTNPSVLPKNWDTLVNQKPTLVGGHWSLASVSHLVLFTLERRCAMDLDFSTTGLEVDTRAKKAIAYRLGKFSDGINDQTKLDVVERVSVAIELEAQFGIEISLAEAHLFETVGEAIECVKRKLLDKEFARNGSRP
jgi:acyl carrier protein